MNSEMTECFGPPLLSHAETMSKEVEANGQGLRDQVAADREWKGTGAPASTLHAFFKKRTSEQAGTGYGSAAGSEGAWTPSHPAGNLHQGSSPRHVMGDLRTTWSPEFSSTAVQSRASVERQSTKGCCESAPSLRLDHMPHGASLEDPGGPERTYVGKGANPGMAYGSSIAISDMVPIHGCTYGQQGQDPSAPSASDSGAQGDHSAAVHTVYDPQVPREQGHQGILGQSLSVPIGGLGPYGGLAQSMAHLGNTLQLLGATDHRDPASQRHAPTLTGSRACAEIDQQLMRLRLLSSSNTCYINATVFAWLRVSQRLECNDRQAYGSKTQAWRHVSQSRRPTHVHTLNSWRSIFAGWQDLHRQQDASEFLEHWVAVGRPQAVTGAWEAEWKTTNSLRLDIIPPLTLP